MEDTSMQIEDIEGIGEEKGGQLRAVGIATTDDLLMAASTPAGRDKVAGMTGISAAQLLKWVNHADLMRIPGVGSEYSDLLEAAGVDSPAELAQRNAANLAQTFQELDAARPNTVRRVPSQETVEEWIAAAKGLEAAVSH
jgi:predicted flap endonuclease-1-like 5' DNA nuclease